MQDSCGKGKMKKPGSGFQPKSGFEKGAKKNRALTEESAAPCITPKNQMKTS